MEETELHLAPAHVAAFVSGGGTNERISQLANVWQRRAAEGRRHQAVGEAAARHARLEEGGVGRDGRRAARHDARGDRGPADDVRGVERVRAPLLGVPVAVARVVARRVAL
eukprot:6133345-Prymnesium_polylepis.1